MVYIITGGPGFGKSTVITVLEQKGFPVGREIARDLLKQYQKNEQGGAPGYPPDFEKNVATERINFLRSVDLKTVAFSDRGLPDQIAFSWYKKKEPSAFMEEAVCVNRYAPIVFYTPPWGAIYVQDEVRLESFAEATQIHDLILKAYHRYGYQTVALPLADPAARADFILNFLQI